MIPSFEANNVVHQLNPILEQWLYARQLVLIGFNNLCLLKPFNSSSTDLRDLQENLEDFCQNLISYVCIGQFQFFGKIASKIEMHETDHILLNQLFNLNQKAIYFKEDHAHFNRLHKLENELSFLGEDLAVRLDIEDKLLNYYPNFFNSQ